MKIRIMTDSTCDLSPDFIRRHNIAVLPLTVNLDGRAYVDDGVDITPDQIFRAVANGSDLPKTSAINVEAYRAAFAAALAEGYDAVVHFAISAECSSCHANAVLASEGMPVYCVDTRSLSCGIGLLAGCAADMIEAGCEDAAAVAERCRALVDKVDCTFIIGRLDYLHKGGRCSSVAMLGANLLNLKPCIEVADGAMSVGRKYRGSFDRCLARYIEDRLRDPETVDAHRLCIVHTGFDDERLDAVRRQVNGLMTFDEVIEVRAGSTISCHCGDAAFGLMFLRK